MGTVSYLPSKRTLPNITHTKDPWPHATPSVVFTLIYILSVVMCFAVGAMCSWHLWSVCKAETSVETHDHAVYRKAAKERGEVCLYFLWSHLNSKR